MLLKERMENTRFSNNERVIIDYLLEKQELIKDYSTTMIAKETYTSPSSLIRISKKLGFCGWNEFKAAFLDEVLYLKSHFHSLDPNIPFTKQDKMMDIAAKLTQLHIESANDTFSLLRPGSLQTATRILKRSSEVHIFAVGNLNYIGEEFVYKLNRIHKKASINPTHDMMYHDSAMMASDECALCISYSGETPSLLKTAQYLKKHHVPVIAITSIGENSLSQCADVTLRITTREKSYSKIAGFTSLNSISLVLDILYSCLFSLDYQANLDYKISIAKEVEANRIIKNQIITEQP